MCSGGMGDELIKNRGSSSDAEIPLHQLPASHYHGVCYN